MKNQLTSFFIISAFLGLMALAGCKHDIALIPEIPVDTTDYTPTDTTGTDTSGTDTTVVVDFCDPDSVYFENDILPILVSNCAMSGCHDATTHKEGVNLTSYNSVMSTGGVKPFNPGGSKLYKSITETEADDRMPPPPASPLTADQKALISKWIQQGALNLFCDANAGGCDTTNVTWSAAVAPILQTHCVGCHNASAASGGVVLNEYGGAAAVALNGKLVGSISAANGFIRMPPSGPLLSDCDITKITKWVGDGAPNN